MEPIAAMTESVTAVKQDPDALCVVCEQPVGALWGGELVHPTCAAGVSAALRADGYGRQARAVALDPTRLSSSCSRG